MPVEGVDYGGATEVALSDDEREGEEGANAEEKQAVYKPGEWNHFRIILGIGGCLARLKSEIVENVLVLKAKITK